MTLETLIAYDEIFAKEFLEKIYARKDKDQPDKYETLEEHSIRTLAKANEIISKLQLGSILTKLNHNLYKEFESIEDEITEEDFNSIMKKLLATIIYLHDIGKVNKQYQTKRLGNYLKGIDGFVDSWHSAYGHMLINQLLFSERQNTIFRKSHKLGFCAIVLTTIVNRHHTPLLDMEIPSTYHSSRNIWDNNVKHLNDNIKGLENTCKQSILLLDDFDKKIEKDIEAIYSDYLEEMGKIPSSMFFIYKLWYSILVQSDCFAAELFSKSDSKINFIDKELAEELQNEFHSRKSYNVGLEEKKYLLSSPIENIQDIDDLRTRILIEASKTLQETIKKDEEKRIFYIDVPTGGGKTNISIKLALDLVKRKNLVRINYVFPFINIIEQNHEEIEATLGQTNKDTVSKIYSFSDWGIENETEDENFKLGNQRFLNYPVNVITNVNFFNIFLKSSKKATMKTLELCNSVVILDEIQSLPNKKWIYFVTLLNKISKLYNIYFIIMSATLPDLKLLLSKDEKKEFDSIDLIEQPESYAKHRLMKRVTYEINKDADPEQEICQILDVYKRLLTNRAYKKILIVVNTISDSIEIYKKIAKPKRFKTFLLNSTTLPYKRKEIINEIKSGVNVILVSTQSVEAGVDIDCDVGIRSDAPLDSIEQIAGRVNRNGKKSVELSKVFVVPSKSKKYVYSGDIRNMYDISGKNGLDCETLLINRDFSSYYIQIMERALQREDMTKANKTDLLEPMNNLEFDKLNQQDYIESRSFSIFLPVKIPLKYFVNLMNFIKDNNLSKNSYLHGNDVWKLYTSNKYENLIRGNDLKKLQLIVQNFCVNLVEPRSSKSSLSFREFIKNTLKFNSENDESILIADENFINKYFDENIGLDIQKLKTDFKELEDTNII